MSVFIIDHVFKNYKVDKQDINVLKDINLSLPNHGLVSIVGKSGSGKSTLLNLLMGIEKPTRGRILFEHKDISKFNDKKFSKYHLQNVSLIFQHYNLFNDETALRNTMIPLLMKGYSRHKAKSLALEYFKKFNLEKIVYSKVKNLSGGEKQRVAIIRSILIKPKVILCDEPTGALDYENSIEIMKILKNLSRDILVILVSHNRELVNRFSDQIIELKDGEVVENLSTITDSFSNNFSSEKIKYNDKWYRKFLLSNLFKNFKKNLFSIVACTISFLAILLSVGFINGSESSQSEALLKNLSSSVSTISKTEYIELENSPLQYQKSTRPSLSSIDEAVGDISSIHVEENLSYLISDFATCSYDKKLITNYSMVPLYDCSISQNSDLLIAGGGIGDNYEEIIVNDEFEKLLGVSALNKEIVLSSESTIIYSTGEKDNPFIKDTLGYSKKFLIKGVVKEFSFLNTPKIYYSYLGAKYYLQSQIMQNVSKYLKKPISYFSYLSNCKEDDAVCSYSYYLFVDDKTEIGIFYDRAKALANEENEIQISSTSFDIKETYSTFISSFSFSLIIFVLIAFLGVNFILGMISLSTFIENKKNTAIMTCLGAQNSSIRNLYSNENLVLVTASFGLAILLSYPLQNFINKILEKSFSLSKLISIPYNYYLNFPFGLLIIIFVVALFFSYLFTLTPMFIYRHFSLADELRDE